MLLLAVLVTIGPSAFNKFGLVWFGISNSNLIISTRVQSYTEIARL